METMENWGFLQATEEGTRITIQVQPRASKNGLAGVQQDALKVRLTAAPVEGEANKECVKFLAKLFGVPKSAVTIQQGLKSRRKTVLITGCRPQQIQRLLRRHGIE